MGKRKYLTDPEVLSLASLGPRELEERIAELGPEATRELIGRLIASYRLASRVANAAWGFWQTWKRGGSPLAQHEQELDRTLQDYAPTDFPKHAGEVETLIEEMKSVLEELEPLTADECRELVALRIQILETDLRSQQKKPIVPRTPA